MQLFSKVWMGKELGGRGWGPAADTWGQVEMVLRAAGKPAAETGAGRGAEAQGSWSNSRGRAQEEVASMLADLGGRESRQPRLCAEVLRWAGSGLWTEPGLASGRRVGQGEPESQAGGRGSGPPSSGSCSPPDISVFG